MYSMCAKKAVSKCDSEGAEAFTSETARKIITLKTKREGGIKCSTGKLKVTRFLTSYIESIRILKYAQI